MWRFVVSKVAKFFQVRYNEISLFSNGILEQDRYEQVMVMQANGGETIAGSQILNALNFKFQLA